MQNIESEAVTGSRTLFDQQIRMKVFTLFLVSGLIGLYAQDDLSARVKQLSAKGEKIADILCDKEKLPSGGGNLEEVIEKVKLSQACPALSKSKLEAVASYVMVGNNSVKKAQISVPADAKCPVCGMFVSKYPKWSAQMIHSGKVYHFDGVKDMMKYYIFDGNFPYDRTKITQMAVSDYYSLEMVDAKEAFYVLDSDVFGPMGRELIPFKHKKSAETFMAEHNGKAIIRFSDITDDMLMKLDGL